MKKIISFFAEPNWLLLVGCVTVIVFIFIGIYWLSKFLANKTKESKKDNASVLGVEHVDLLFKVREIDNGKKVALLSSDPTREYSSGTGNPTWFKNLPDDIRVEGKVLKVAKVDGKIVINPVRYDMLPTENETIRLKEARAKALDL
jgi:hypothetical protein